MNVEYRHESGFCSFFKKISGRTVAVLCDVNTEPYARGIITEMRSLGADVICICFPDEELIPTEDKCEYALQKATGADYLLAVGSGTLNDMSKSVSYRLGIPCGVLATAASMDGYCSSGAALMRKGFKVTDATHSPEDVLIDLEIIKNAPRLMTASGFGDIIGKYTCLADWKMSSIVNGEAINAEAFGLMEQARADCINAFDSLVRYESSAVEKLMRALITAGTSMAICGNSRPASGSEHHLSHFLEMDFARRGEKIPMHGLKVAIGTLISLELYSYLRSNNVKFDRSDEVYKMAEELPCIESMRDMLIKMGCPVRFSQLGVCRETMEKMIESAYTVRDRYTVLTLIHELGLTEQVKPILMEKYF